MQGKQLAQCLIHSHCSKMINYHKIYFSEASAPWEITPLFLEVTRAHHLWDHKEVFSGMMWWSSASSVSGWAFNPCWVVGDPSSSQLVVASAGSEACHDSTVALGVICCFDVTARLSCKAAPHSGVPVCKLSDYSAHNVLSLGLEGSVHGDCSIRQIRVKDNILSSILLLSLPASFVFS